MYRFHKGHFAGILVLLLMIMMVGLYSSTNSTYAQEPDSLSLGPGDFPSDAKTLSAGYVDAGKILHPFHLADFPESPGSERKNQKPALYEYTKVHLFSSAIPGQDIVVVGNWIYSYTSSEQAAAAADVTRQDLKSEGAQLLGKYTSGAKPVEGEVYYMTGKDSDAIYWFVGAVDSNLFLVVANGLKQEPTQAGLESALKLTLAN